MEGRKVKINTNSLSLSLLLARSLNEAGFLCAYILSTILIIIIIIIILYYYLG